MPDIPRDPSLDSTLALLSEGYTFISARCRRHRSDLFETRIMFERVICMLGEEAARLFYEGDRVTRRRAMPAITLWLLQDKGSAQLLDGTAHRWRKRMFLSLMTPDSIRRLGDIMTGQWRMAAARWEGMDTVVLHREVEEILCRAACAWAGVPLAEAEAAQRTREFAAMVDGAGAAGPRNWRGQLLRARTERWIRSLVEDVRSGRLDAPEGSAVHTIAGHRDSDGKPLDVKVAAVEIINVLRPTVAVARYVTFAALALHQFPECRQELEAGRDEYLDLFVQEVRRFYPFFPFVGGRVREATTWMGHHFTEGTWVLLDLYGTNHDPRIWPEPGAFRPERFRQWDGGAFSFIPQGGGDHDTTHRCAGEWITIDLMKRAVRLLVEDMRYEVPAQDLRIDLSRMPAIPNSGFVVTRVRRAR